MCGARPAVGQYAGNVAMWMFNRSLWMLVEVVLSRSKSLRTKIGNFTFKWIWERLFQWVFHKLNITFHIEYKFKEIYFPLFSFWAQPKELFYRSSLQVIRLISPKTYQVANTEEKLQTHVYVTLGSYKWHSQMEYQWISSCGFTFTMITFRPGWSLHTEANHKGTKE
jgi:hypothetical protein